VCPGPIPQDPAIILFREGRPDIFQAHGILEPHGVPIDPTSREIYITLDNEEGVVFAASLIPGDLFPGATTLRFRDRNALKGLGRRFGLYEFKMQYRARFDRWYFSFKAYADMSRATTPNMVLQVQIGDRGWVSNTPWKRTARGWRSQFPVAN
jgi:hypothetical protein